jgi:hypothetical protein
MSTTPTPNLAFLLAACALIGCGNSGDSGSNAGGGGSSASGGAAGAGGGNTGGIGNSSGTGGSATGGSSSFCVIGSKGCLCDAGLCAAGLVCKNEVCCDQATGDCAPPPVGTGGSGGGSAGGAGSGGAAGSGTVCTPGVVGPVITDCGYPYDSSNPLTSVDFNESEVLRAIDPSGGAPLASIRLFYNDEHALTLGVKHVDVITSSGTSGKDYPVSPLVTDPDQVHFPQTGTNETTGDYSGLDQSGRPMWPALFVTDITNNPNDTSGDWQMGGTPYNPNVVFGSWKSAVRTVDKTVNPVDISITPDADPAKNNWDLGGGDPVPSSLKVNQGYGAEVRWDVVLLAGHSYRIQVLVHDGDQNKAGGDSGEACVHFCADNSCPQGSASCDANTPCAGDKSCVGGCCLAIPK